MSFSFPSTFFRARKLISETLEKKEAFSLSNSYHVVPDHLDLGQVPAHLVVQLRKPVRDPELERDTRPSQLVDVERLHHALGDVHAARRLEAVVGDRVGLLIQEQAELVVLDALLADGAGEGEALVEGEPEVGRLVGGGGGGRRRRGGKTLCISFSLNQSIDRTNDQ